jgi:hypothetical protein
MNHLKISNPDDLLIHQENPEIVKNQIIEYPIQLKNPPHSLRYATPKPLVSQSEDGNSKIGDHT